MPAFHSSFNSLKENTVMSNSKCPIDGFSFCWKNVNHWVVALAILPFSLAGVGVVVSAVQALVAFVVK